MSDLENNPQIKSIESKEVVIPSTPPTHKASPILDWVVRLIKGLIVGIGFIVPGLSGGVLAVVLKVYEPILNFLANPFKKLKANIRFLLPVGLGGAVGIFLFSAFVDFAFTNYAPQFTWLFIGFIAGTFPSLYKTSGNQGRKSWHWALLLLLAVATFFLMGWMETIRNMNMTPSVGGWLLSGLLIGLGLVIPGLSPSNFLIYLGLYQPMANGIKELNLGVIIPLLVGFIICILLFAKLVSWLFKKHYAFMYYLILGIVVGSTAAIIPGGVNGWTIAICALLFLFGAACSYGLSVLEERFPHESIF